MSTWRKSWTVYPEVSCSYPSTINFNASQPSDYIVAETCDSPQSFFVLHSLGGGTGSGLGGVVLHFQYLFQM